MTHKQLAIISFSSFFLGIILFLYMTETIIFRHPFKNSSFKTEQKNVGISKKEITLFIWKNNDWYTEKQTVLWDTDTEKQVDSIIRAWLSLLADETNHKHVQLQSVVQNPSSKEVYISFDRQPFLKELSTYEKWMWIEGLLKTIRQTQIHLPGIYFLVHHTPIADYHLDFSHAWPLQGFA